MNIINTRRIQGAYKARNDLKYCDRGEGDGCLYMVHETLLSHRDETLEDVEGGRELSESLVVFLGFTRHLTSS